MSTSMLQIHTFQLKIQDSPCSPDVSCTLSSPPPTPISETRIATKPSIRTTPRKEFIRDYARMAPYLRPQKSPLLGKRPDLVPVRWELGRSQAKHGLVQCTTITIGSTHPDHGSKQRVTRRNKYDNNTGSSSSSGGGGDDSVDRATTPTTTSATSAATRDMSHENISAAPNLAATNKKDDEGPVVIARSRRSSAGGREVRIKGLILAYAFETLDIDSSDASFFPPDWIPRSDRLDQIKVDFSWKGHPLSPNAKQPYFDRLHSQEIKIVCHMRMTPAIYLRCKRAIIMAAREFTLHNLDFRKSDAQKVCRIDVNKSSRLWAVFDAYGWLNSHCP